MYVCMMIFKIVILFSKYLQSSRYTNKIYSNSAHHLHDLLWSIPYKSRFTIAKKNIDTYKKPAKQLKNYLQTFMILL